jgi:hypothetical protein
VQVETLAAREDRRGQLVHLGRGENELHVRGRFLQRLEQRVERRRRQHVDLVDDVNLVAALGRRVADVVAQLAHLLDTVVGRAVDLQHVERAALGDLLADFLLRIEVGGGAVGGLERLGENARGGSLACAARPDEKVSLRNAAESQRVGQRAHHRLLPDDLRERLRPVLARKNLVSHGTKILPPARTAASLERLFFN